MRSGKLALARWVAGIWGVFVGVLLVLSPTMAEGGFAPGQPLRTGSDVLAPGAAFQQPTPSTADQPTAAQPLPTRGLPPTLAPTVGPATTATPEPPVTHTPTPAMAAPLPHTATNAPLVGWATMLLGFALVIHNAQRMRWTNWLLADQRLLWQSFEPLVATMTQTTYAIQGETTSMNDVCQEMLHLLRRNGTL